MPEPQRHDPVSRPVDGAINQTSYWMLPNGFDISTDPKWVYCEANPNDEATGVRWMSMNGWEIVPVHDDSPMLVGGSASNDGVSMLVRFGQVLMRRPRAKQDEYEQAKAQNALAVARSIGRERIPSDSDVRAVDVENNYRESRRS